VTVEKLSEDSPGDKAWNELSVVTELLQKEEKNDGKPHEGQIHVHLELCKTYSRVSTSAKAAYYSQVALILVSLPSYLENFIKIR